MGDDKTIGSLNDFVLNLGWVILVNAFRDPKEVKTQLTSYVKLSSVHIFNPSGRNSPRVNAYQGVVERLGVSLLSFIFLWLIEGKF